MEEMENTPIKRQGGYGKLRGAVDGVPFATAGATDEDIISGKRIRQPSGGNKSKGKQAVKEEQQKMQFTRELIKDLLARQYKFSEKSLTDTDGIGKRLVDAYGEEVLKKSAGEIAVLVALSRAIVTKDTTNLFSLLNQAFGLPKQTLANDPENPFVNSFDWGKIPLHLRLQIAEHINDTTEGKD